MKVLLCLAAVAVAFCSADYTPPKVQVYSTKPGKFGEDNTLICHVSNFHPPDISIDLIRENGAIPGSHMTDLAFKQDWHFFLTRSAPFTPQEGERVLCRVTHGSKVSDYAWEPNM